MRLHHRTPSITRTLLTMSVAALALLAQTPAEAGAETLAPELEPPSQSDAAAAREKPVRAIGAPEDGEAKAPVFVAPGSSDATARGIRARVRILRARSKTIRGSLATKVKVKRLGRGPLRKRFPVLIPGGRHKGVTVGTSAWPVMKRGMKLRARFVIWRGAWTLVSAEAIGRKVERRGGPTQARWSKYGCCWFNIDRLPVRWRTDPGVPGWATARIGRAWEWINGISDSYVSGTFAGYGRTGHITTCGQGSWVSFRPLPPGILGFGTYCSDARGAYELHAELNRVITYDIATVAAHEVMHGLGLNHSSDRGAIMYHQYQRAFGGLGTDDRNGLRHLYPGRAGFSMHAQHGIRADGTVHAAYPGSAEVVFDLRVHGHRCDTGSLWLQLEHSAFARFLSGPSFERGPNRLRFAATGDPYLCRARVTFRAPSSGDSSPGRIRFYPAGPEGRLPGPMPSFVGVLDPARLGSQLIAPTGEQQVASGGSRLIEMRIRNTGAESWSRGQVNLHFVDANGNDLTYNHCGTNPRPPEWGNGNAIPMVESNVASGQAATFRIRICGQAGYQGPAIARFRTVAERRAHFGPIHPLRLRFVSDDPPDGGPQLDSQLVSPTSEQAVRTGGSRVIEMRIRNTGTETWRRGQHNIHYVDANGRDLFYDYCGTNPRPPEWGNGNAITMVESTVPSGELATFRIRICGQAGYQGPATARFRTVSERVAHFGPIHPLRLRFAPDAPG